jgi:arylsulfatase A-like enzyme
MYEGGIRVPGIIEWPARIPSPRTSDVPAVTSDMLPTLCELTGQSLPDRPLDGISLKNLIDGSMDGRPLPICFWQYSNTGDSTQTPYIEPGLQEGTTPLVKQMNGLYTRNFRNFRLEEISERDYVGPRAILGDRYKLVIGPGEDPEIELFDLRADPSEGINLAASKPELTDSMQRQLRSWQQSVLESLTGKDYRQATLRSGE